MGIPYIIYKDSHRCTLCNQIYECVNLENNFCSHGYHSITNVFLCNNCPEKINTYPSELYIFKVKI